MSHGSETYLNTTNTPTKAYSIAHGNKPIIQTFSRYFTGNSQGVKIVNKLMVYSNYFKLRLYS